MISSDAITIMSFGATFIYIGIDLRRRQKGNWRAFLLGGITFVAIVVLALILGWKV
jgi:hypothetical protein